MVELDLRLITQSFNRGSDVADYAQSYIIYLVDFVSKSYVFQRACIYSWISHYIPFFDKLR